MYRVWLWLWKTLIGVIPMVTMAESLRTGTTYTLTWIACIHSHTYFNTVTTTWCKAPAQLLFFSACWVFSCFRNPPNSDMDYRFLIMRTWWFLCVCVHTGVWHTDSEWVCTTFFLEKLTIFSSASDRIRTFILWIRVQRYQLSHPVTLLRMPVINNIKNKNKVHN